MSRPGCALCQRFEIYGERNICSCDPDPGVAWDCLAARKITGPCGPEGRLYLGPVEDAPAPLPKPRRYWTDRRAGCLAAAAISIMFWLLVILAVSLGRG